MENSMKLSQKMKNTTHGPSTPLLGLYPKETKSFSQRCTCNPILTEALLRISKTCECLSVHQWMNIKEKVVCMIHTNSGILFRL